MRRWRDGCPTVEPWVPVLTGFVRSVGRDEQVGADGRVQRQVVIAGQDCGAAFLMEQVSAFITYQNSADLGATMPAAFNWLREYGLEYDMQMVGDFIWDVATKPTQSIMDAAGFAFQKQFSVEKGTVRPFSAFSQEGTIWEMLYRYADGPWNELFVRENRNMYPDPSNPCPEASGRDIHDPELLNPELVFRPTPWLDRDESPLPDANLDTVMLWKIKLAHVLALRAHRDDSELVNHVWIHSPMMQPAAMTQLIRSKETGIAAGNVNSGTRDKFGDRIQQEATRITNLAQAPVNNTKDEQRARELDTFLWVRERQEWILKAQSDIHEFERGSITMKGYPMMRVGDYFELPRGDIVWKGYITNIVHDFQPYKRYLTTLDYIRGTQIFERRKVNNPWDVERKTGETS
jgi:hypothetical protein